MRSFLVYSQILSSILFFLGMAYHILLIPALILPLLIYYAVPPKTKERLDAEDRKRAHTKRVASFKEKVAQHLLLNEPYLEKRIWRDRTDYEAYYKTSVWATLRLKRLAIDNLTCQDCLLPLTNATASVHHKSYDRFFGDEQMSDLTTLCHSCHKSYHSHMV